MGDTKACIVLNGEVLVLVAPSKRLLCEETFKHFTELRWAGQSATSPDFSLEKEAGSILKKLSIPHEVISIGEGNFSSMQLWEKTRASMPSPTAKPSDPEENSDGELPID